MDRLKDFLGDEAIEEIERAIADIYRNSFPLCGGEIENNLRLQRSQSRLVQAVMAHRHQFARAAQQAVDCDVVQ